MFLSMRCEPACLHVSATVAYVDPVAPLVMQIRQQRRVRCYQYTGPCDLIAWNSCACLACLLPRADHPASLPMHFAAARSTCVAVGGPDYCIIAASTRMSTGFSILTRNSSMLMQL